MPEKSNNTNTKYKYFVFTRRYEYETTNLSLEGRDPKNYTYKNVQNALENKWNEFTEQQWIDNIKEEISAIPNVVHCLLAIHNKDTEQIKEETKPVSLHIHGFIEFINPQIVESKRKELNPLNDRIKNFEKTTTPSNAVKYLLHMSESAFISQKYIYPFDNLIVLKYGPDKLIEVTDETEKREIYGKITSKSDKASSRKTDERLANEFKELCEKVLDGEYTVDEAKQHWRNTHQGTERVYLTIGKINELESNRKEYLDTITTVNHRTIVYIYGAGGVGKSTLSKILAKQMNLDEYKSINDTFKVSTGKSTINTMFNGYEGQNTIIAEEINNKIFSTKDEWCSFHDTTDLDVNRTNQRFKNLKILAQNYIYNQNKHPFELATSICKKENNEYTSDEVWQIARRIATSIKLTEDLDNKNHKTKSIIIEIFIHTKNLTTEKPNQILIKKFKTNIDELRNAANENKISKNLEKIIKSIIKTSKKYIEIRNEDEINQRKEILERNKAISESISKNKKNNDPLEEWNKLLETNLDDIDLFKDFK